MSRIQSNVRNSADIDRPKCPACGSEMWLCKIAKQTDGEGEWRTFQCPVCEVSMGEEPAGGGPPEPKPSGAGP